MKLVYRHRRNDNNEIFYVGIGKKYRPYNKNRNNLWQKIVDKTDYTIEIVATGLSKEDACELEMLLISEYGRKDLNTGTLSNLTDGGDGIKNVSEETKQKISRANIGRIVTKETIQKLKDNHKGMYGKTHSAKTLDKMRFNKINLRPVLQYDLTGNLINEFRSTQEAKRSLKKTSMSINNCLAGVSKSAFGFKWKYKNI